MMRPYWGSIIRDRRLEMGMSIDRLAIKSGVSGNSIKSMESGVSNATVTTLERVLNTLALDLEVVDSVLGSPTPLAIMREQRA